MSETTTPPHIAQLMDELHQLTEEAKRLRYLPPEEVDQKAGEIGSYMRIKRDEIFRAWQEHLGGEADVRLLLHDVKVKELPSGLLKRLVGKLNGPCRKSMEAAALMCSEKKNYKLEIEHWLYKLVELDGATDFMLILKEHRIDPLPLKYELERNINLLSKGPDKTPSIGPLLTSLLNHAWLIALEFGCERIRTSHVLLALLDKEEILSVSGDYAGHITHRLSADSLRWELQQGETTANSVEQYSPGELSVTPIFHRKYLQRDPKLVFTLMPFSEPWSEYVWSEEIKPAVEGIENLSLKCVRADDLYGHDVMVDVYESILRARIVLADITGSNANVFYELGIAHTMGKDVILLSQGADQIPFDLKRFRHCIYSNDESGFRILREYLENAIVSILEEDITSGIRSYDNT